MSEHRVIRKLSSSSSPSVKGQHALLYLLGGLLFFKFLWFDFCWCLLSTFRPFSSPETYLYAALAMLILLFPLVVWRMERTTWFTAILLDILLVCNLMYFRTYYTAIPLDSYWLVGNLKDFTDSVWGSFRITDLVFPLSTVAAAIARRRMKCPATLSRSMKEIRVYALLTGGFVLIAGSTLWLQGGFKKVYEALQDSYTHTCGTPMYTVFGSICYDYMRDVETYTPEVGIHIEDWLRQHPPMSAPTDTTTRTHCIVIYKLY